MSDHRRPDPRNGCAWCSCQQVQLTADHVFPRSIGGTRELVLAACDGCQQVLSDLELELSRRSTFALCTIEKGPVGRHRHRSNSGVIQAQYVLVREPSGGYAETLIQAGKPPERLPSIEIDVPSGQKLARRKAKSAAEMAVFIRELRSLFDRGELARIQLRLTPLHEIENEPDFWPRVVREKDGAIFMRARDVSEAQLFLSDLRLLLPLPLLDDYSRWSNAELPAEPIHHTSVRFDAVEVHRALTKIAFAMSLLRYGQFCLSVEGFARKRKYVRHGDGTDLDSIYSDLGEFDGLDASAEYHLAHVGSYDGRIVGLVSVYGFMLTVDFGEEPLQLHQASSITARCRTDGRGCEVVAGDIAVGIATELLDKARQAKVSKRQPEVDVGEASGRSIRGIR
jgi:hypothetical protein